MSKSEPIALSPADVAQVQQRAEELLRVFKQARRLLRDSDPEGAVAQLRRASELLTQLAESFASNTALAEVAGRMLLTAADETRRELTDCAQQMLLRTTPESKH